MFEGCLILCVGKNTARSVLYNLEVKDWHVLLVIVGSFIAKTTALRVEIGPTASQPTPMFSVLRIHEEQHRVTFCEIMTPSMCENNLQYLDFLYVRAILQSK